MRKPMGAMYALIKLEEQLSSKMDDQEFALQLLEHKHVLVAPGTSFNTAYADHFRIRTLPDPDAIHEVFDRIDSLLSQHT